MQACADVVAGGKRAEILPRVAFEDPTAASLLEILSRKSVQQSPSARLFVEQAIDLLCTRLVLGHSSIGALPAPENRRGLGRWQVKRVTSFMRDNLDRQIGLDDLANLINLSRFHFCTAFRQATGHTPYQWLTMQRIGRARDLLADPKLTVTDVALAVGYETPSAFAASFRKVTGASPSHFRRQMLDRSQPQHRDDRRNRRTAMLASPLYSPSVFRRERTREVTAWPRRSSSPAPARASARPRPSASPGTATTSSPRRSSRPQVTPLRREGQGARSRQPARREARPARSLRRRVCPELATSTCCGTMPAWARAARSSRSRSISCAATTKSTSSCRSR